MRMLFDGKARVNGCTFCCSAICQGGFLNCHTIFMSISLSLLSLRTVTPLMKGQARNIWRGTQSTRWHFSSLFFVEHSLTYFPKCHVAYQNFFSVICLITYCTGYSYVEAWFEHCITLVQYSHFSQR